MGLPSHPFDGADAEGEGCERRKSESEVDEVQHGFLRRVLPDPSPKAV